MISKLREQQINLPKEDAFDLPLLEEPDWEYNQLMKSRYDFKASNPKDNVGSRKWRQFSTMPIRVLWEVAVGMMEGAMKYGRHNYRHTGVRATVYSDAAVGHIMQWQEGEDIDADSGLSHITKAICSLMVLRDGMLEGNFQDDRPMKHHGLDAHRAGLQAIVDQLMERYPDPSQSFTEAEFGRKGATDRPGVAG